MNVVKEVDHTDSFHGLESQAECQDEESLLDCQTRQTVDKIREDCQCLPLSIRLTNEVD